MSKTALQLRQELGNRMGELILSTPTSPGTSTTLIDTKLTQWMPNNLGQGVEKFMPWAYGTNTADVGNQAQERRAVAWDGVSTLSFFQGNPWPVPITTGTYEVHLRWPASRKLEAINEAVGQLALWWYREFVYTDFTTQPVTWAYTFPSTVYISKIWQIQYQVDLNPAVNVGLPYADAGPLDWELRESVDTAGNLTQTLQFGILPPPGRTLRIRGEAYFPDLANDTDVLGLAGKWERPALAWIYAYAANVLNLWMGDMQPAGEVDRYGKRQEQLLAEGERLKAEMNRPHKPGRIVVPGRGQGLLGYPSPLANPAWLGGLHGSGS